MKGIVYYKNRCAGHIWKNEEDQFFFQYALSYLENKEARAISYTLPLKEQRFEAGDLFSFFDGIIPEGWLLSLAIEKWKLNPLQDRFELLLSTCKDAIGAVSVRSSVEEKDENTVAVHAAERKEVVNIKESYKEKYQRCLYCYEDLEKEDYLYHKKCARKLFDTHEVPFLDLDEKMIQDLGGELVNQKLSITGVQRKLSLDFISEDKSGKGNRLTIVNLWGRYIFKPKGEPPHLPENEHLIMQIARSVGIECAECGLLPLSNGEFGLISRRFDRGKKGEKFHMEDFCQILGKPTYKKYTGSIEQIAVVLKKLDVPGDNLYRLFELVVFSYFMGNIDLHLKNISLLYENEKYGEITRLSPCYDLLSTDLYISGDEDSALAINGKKNKLQKEDFDRLGEKLELSVKVREGVYRRLLQNIEKSMGLVHRSYLADQDKKKLIDIIKKRMKLFT